MIAEKYGAYADQLRYRADWKKKAEHQKDTNCKGCDFFKTQSDVGTKNWCKRHNFQTQLTARCPRHAINGQQKHKKMLFVPLKKIYYQKFETGEQTCEVRPNNHRFWTEENVYPGRIMTLSCGYGKQNRLHKKIMRVEVSNNLQLDEFKLQLPQWHIDAVLEIYGQRNSWLIAYV